MDAEKLRNAILAHIESGEYGKALSLYKSLAETGNKKLTFDDWFKKGLCHFHLDEDEKAIECYENALRIEKNNFQAMTNKAISLLKLDRVNGAFVLFRQALDINPDIGPAWLQIGCYYLYKIEELNDAGVKAINAFRRAVSLVPSFGAIEVFFPTADCYITIDVLLESFKSLRELDDHSILLNPEPVRYRGPNDPQYWTSANPNAVELNRRALSLCAEGRHEEAINLLNQALVIDPEYLKAWYNKGKILRTAGRFEESVACCEQIAAIDSQYPDFWTMLANNYISLRKYEEALEALRKAIHNDDKDPRAWFNKALLEESLGMDSEAIKSYTHFIKIAPAQDYQELIDRARLKISSY